MQVGIIGGTGPAGQALGTRLSAVGAQVILGSRQVERGIEVAAAVIERWPDRGLSITGGTNEDAASAEIVVLATPWEGAAATALGLASQLAGKTLVSMVNALTRIGREFQALVPVRGSIAATLQAIMEQTSVTCAFQHLPAGALGDLDQVLSSDVLVCADSEDAANETVALVETVPGLRAVRAGSLASANAVEALTAVLLNVNIRYKTHVSLSLEGLGGEGGR